MSSDHDNHKRLYLWVWSGLLFLTVVEIVLAYQSLSVAVMLGLLVFIGEAVRDAFDPRKTQV